MPPVNVLRDRLVRANHAIRYKTIQERHRKSFVSHDAILMEIVVGTKDQATTQRDLYVYDMIGQKIFFSYHLPNRGDVVIGQRKYKEIPPREPYLPLERTRLFGRSAPMSLQPQKPNLPLERIRLFEASARKQLQSRVPDLALKRYFAVACQFSHRGAKKIGTMTFYRIDPELLSRRCLTNHSHWPMAIGSPA